MLMVQLLCTNLKSIRFRQNNPTEDADQLNDLSIHELKSMLAVEYNCWSKVSRIRFSADKISQYLTVYIYILDKFCKV